MNIDIGVIVGIVDKAGTLGLLLIFLVGLAKRWWVMGWTYKEALDREADWIEREREWMEIAVPAVRAAEQVINRQAATRRVTDRLKRERDETA